MESGFSFSEGVKTMRCVFMVEELSMKELLDTILPRILPNEVVPIIIPHYGKSDLEKSIGTKLRAWQDPDDIFVIVHDQDSNDCITLKTNLLSLCKNSRNACLVRIACVELESWYFGDLKALSLTYGKDFTTLANKQKFRDPDKIQNAKHELRKIIPSYKPVSSAREIAAKMDIYNNKSHSFNVFLDGVKKMCGQ